MNGCQKKGVLRVDELNGTFPSLSRLTDTRQNNTINALIKMKKYALLMCALLFICIVPNTVSGNGGFGSGSGGGGFGSGGFGSGGSGGGFGNAEQQGVNFDDQKDAQGYTWDIQKRGIIDDGTNYVFSSGFKLSINGNEVGFSERKMTSGGGEYMFSGSHGDFHITRRAKVLTSRSAIRYIETVRNTTSQKKECVLQVNTRFSDQVHRIINSSGDAEDGTLKAGERAIAAVNRGKRPSVLFMVGGGRTNVHPSISTDDTRINVKYTVDVPAREQVSIAHLGAQRRNLTKPELVRKESGPFLTYGRLKIDVSREVASSVKNWDVQGSSIGVPPYRTLMTPLDETLSKRGLETLDRDQVTLRDGSHLKGDIVWQSLTVKSPYGTVQLQPEQVALFLGSAGGKQEPVVYLRNGEIFSGTLIADGLKLKSEHGTSIPLSPDQVDAVVFRASDSGLPQPEGTELMVDSYSGNRIRLRVDDGFRFRVTTPWGPASFDPDQLRVLQFRSDPQPLFHLYLNNGTHVPVFLRNETVAGTHPEFGEMEIASQSIAELSNIRFYRNVSNNQLSGAEDHPHLLLDGRYVLVGQFEFNGLTFTSVSTSLSVLTDRIRRMKQIEGSGHYGEPASFLMELTGGDVLRGTAGTDSLSVDVGGQSLTIPAGKIQMYRKPEEADRPSPEDGETNKNSDEKEDEKQEENEETDETDGDA